jgi:hypothetical protein
VAEKVSDPTMGAASKNLSKELGPDSIPTRVANVKEEVIEGELLLYHSAQTKALYLNPSAATIWGLCNGQRTLKEIVDLIAESYPDSRPTVAEDVLMTLESLERDRVLAFAPRPPELDHVPIDIVQQVRR